MIGSVLVFLALLFLVFIIQPHMFKPLLMAARISKNRIGATDLMNTILSSEKSQLHCDHIQ